MTDSGVSRWTLAAPSCLPVFARTRTLFGRCGAQADYKAEHHVRLPEHASVVKYTTSFTPSSISAGDKATLNSYIEVVKGKQDAADPLIEEEATI